MKKSARGGRVSAARMPEPDTTPVTASQTSSAAAVPRVQRRVSARRLGEPAPSPGGAEHDRGDDGGHKSDEGRGAGG
jgi:hypothetical protein